MQSSNLIAGTQGEGHANRIQQSRESKATGRETFIDNRTRQRSRTIYKKSMGTENERSSNKKIECCFLPEIVKF